MTTERELCNRCGEFEDECACIRLAAYYAGKAVDWLQRKENSPTGLQFSDRALMSLAESIQCIARHLANQKP